MAKQSVFWGVWGHAPRTFFNLELLRVVLEHSETVHEVVVAVVLQIEFSWCIVCLTNPVET